MHRQVVELGSSTRTTQSDDLRSRLKPALQRRTLWADRVCRVQGHPHESRKRRIVKCRLERSENSPTPTTQSDNLRSRPGGLPGVPNLRSRRLGSVWSAHTPSTRQAPVPTACSFRARCIRRPLKPRRALRRSDQWRRTRRGSPAERRKVRTPAPSPWRGSGTAASRAAAGAVRRACSRLEAQSPRYGPVPTPPGAGSKLNTRNISWPGDLAARGEDDAGARPGRLRDRQCEGRRVTTTLNAPWDEELAYACEVAVALKIVIAEMRRRRGDRDRDGERRGRARGDRSDERRAASLAYGPVTLIA